MFLADCLKDFSILFYIWNGKQTFLSLGAFINKSIKGSFKELLPLAFFPETVTYLEAIPLENYMKMYFNFKPGHP